MKFEQIESLVRLVAETKVAEVEVKMSGVHVRVVRDAAISAAPSVVHVAAATAPAPAAHPAPAASAPAAAASGARAAAPEAEDDGLHVIAASMVGTFYRRAHPEAEPFVKEGDVIKKGQVVCILEAMKIMNEIESDCAGTVVRVLRDDGQPVEYGEKLLVVRPL